MWVRRFAARAWVAGTAGLIVLASPEAAAQAQGAAAPLAVTLTVVRSCTVGAVAAPASAQAEVSDPSAPASPPGYEVRCGRQSAVAPAQPGSIAGLPSADTPATIGKSADGRTLVVQF